ncbi:MAG: hypothetical protein V4618_00910 [Pseudomonadota bacterium]
MPLVADRWTGMVRCLRLLDVDLSAAGSDWMMQIRRAPNLPDGEGEPLRTFERVEIAVARSSPGISLAAVHLGRPTPTSLLNLRTFDLSDLPFPADRGDDMRLAYDLHIKVGGPIWQRAAWGPFTIRAGVTKPSFLLAENDGFLLAEDGERIIKE